VRRKLILPELRTSIVRPFVFNPDTLHAAFAAGSGVAQRIHRLKMLLMDPRDTSTNTFGQLRMHTLLGQILNGEEVTVNRLPVQRSERAVPVQVQI
jgi:hypothetical protein